ncbi:hypothetical protein QA612_09740 [Evansella sp. AB-P1]|uniref:hypothetical protein n=1 Tax=Evansella sp. AB-P1 TaxID=3037653 RepID=UPI00241DAC24|nr:hypothetical protein [Evansella sp. AB-P1]MDG5787781.1 hypothetical protein [Evansella sp. AB-P1]
MDIIFFPVFLGIFGNIFGNLFGVIWDAITWIGDQIGSFFSWLGSLIADLFNSLLELLMAFFEVIYAIIDGILYFLFQIGLLAVKLFLIFFELAKLIYSFFMGLANTLASLSYSPQSSSGHGYSEMIGNIFNALEPMQLDTIAYILLFIIWLFTAITVIKLLSSIRVGGE